MGYFASNDQWHEYLAQWCERCVHDTDKRCAVLRLQLAYNEGAAERTVLDELIPIKNGANQKCAMFMERD
jgi:hypothetical protein